MAVALPEFSDWLGHKLKDLNTDENVFGDYITGILDSDETSDEKSEALQDLLGEIVEDQSINELCTEIMNMYVQFQDKKAHTDAANSKPIEVDIKLKELAAQHCLPAKSKQYTEEEKKIREAILAQYSQMSDEEDEEGDCVASSSSCSAASMQKNTNAYDVAQAEKEKRENARQDSQKKKEKDKEDREKQKQMKEDKKEKRKTQKGERRR